MTGYVTHQQTTTLNVILSCTTKFHCSLVIVFIRISSTTSHTEMGNKRRGKRLTRPKKRRPPIRSREEASQRSVSEAERSEICNDNLEFQSDDLVLELSTSGSNDSDTISKW